MPFTVHAAVYFEKLENLDMERSNSLFSGNFSIENGEAILYSQ